MIYLAHLLLTVVLVCSTLASGDEGGVAEDQRVKRQGFTNFGQNFFLPTVFTTRTPNVNRPTVSTSFRFPNSSPGGSTITPGRLVSTSNGFFPSQRIVTSNNLNNILFRPVNVPAQRSTQRQQQQPASTIIRQQPRVVNFGQQQRQQSTQRQTPVSFFTGTNFGRAFSPVFFSRNNQAPAPASTSVTSSSPVNNASVRLISSGLSAGRQLSPSFFNQFPLGANIRLVLPGQQVQLSNPQQQQQQPQQQQQQQPAQEQQQQQQLQQLLNQQRQRQQQQLFLQQQQQAIEQLQQQQQQVRLLQQAQQHRQAIQRAAQKELLRRQQERAQQKQQTILEQQFVKSVPQQLSQPVQKTSQLPVQQQIPVQQGEALQAKQQQQQPQQQSQQQNQQQQPNVQKLNSAVRRPVSLGSRPISRPATQTVGRPISSTRPQTVGVPLSSTGPQGPAVAIPSRNQFTSFSNTPQFSNQFSLVGNPIVQPIRSFTIDLSREDDDDSDEIFLLNRNQNNAFSNNNQFQLSNAQGTGQFRVVPDITDELFDDSDEIFLLNRNQNNAFSNNNQFQLSNAQGTGQFRVVPDITDELFDDDSREIFLRTSGFTSARGLFNPSALTPRPRNNQGVATAVRGRPQRPLFSDEFTNEQFDTTDELFDDSNERFRLFPSRFSRPNVRAKRDLEIDSDESHENDFMTIIRPKPIDRTARNFQQYNFDTIGSHENDFMSGAITDLVGNVRAKRDLGIDSPESHENDFMTIRRPKPIDRTARNFQQYNFDTIGSHENDFMSGEVGTGEVLD